MSSNAAHIIRICLRAVSFVCLKVVEYWDPIPTTLHRADIRFPGGTPGRSGAQPRSRLVLPVDVKPNEMKSPRGVNFYGALSADDSRIVRVIPVLANGS